MSAVLKRKIATKKFQICSSENENAQFVAVIYGKDFNTGLQH